MKIAFVIGGAGFVGSHLVQWLLGDAAIERVVVFDNFSSGKLEHLRDVKKDGRLTIYGNNVRDYDALRAAMERTKPDVVFHLAANPDIARAATEPTIDFEQGTVLTKNVLEAMRVCGVRRLVYFSGSGIYGDCGDLVLRESMPCRPVSAYGASKLASEAMIQAYVAMFDLSAIILRPANIVGPRQTHGVGYDFVRRLRADPTQLRILGNGRQSKSYVHVEDVVAAVRLALGRAHTCSIYNLAAPDYLTVARIAELAIDLVCGDGATLTVSYTGGDRGWRGDVPVVRFDCSALRAIGWVPQRTSEQAMQAALTAMLAEVQTAEVEA